MILCEQGKWLPTNAIAKYIPEFAPLKGYKGMGADGKMILVEPNHPPNVHELMSHTAGFTYGFFGSMPADSIGRDQHVLFSRNLQDKFDKLARIPLPYQPGKGWTYIVSMDIESYIVEELSGQSLPDFMREQIFKPLGMRHGLLSAAAKHNRFVTLYRTGPHGELIADATGGGLAGDYTAQSTMPSGGGMVSTAEDYYRFALMLANGGELDGARILTPSTVKLMTSNHLAATLLAGQFGIGLQVMRPGFGFGYNCAVIFGPPSQSARRQRHLLLGWSRRNLVLGRSHQQYRLRGHDSAHIGPANPNLK
jgi:CubicO group peptidase (beta-lactamase class C family)